jgi:hypothetical protein
MIYNYEMTTYKYILAAGVISLFSTLATGDTGGTALEIKDKPETNAKLATVKPTETDKSIESVKSTNPTEYVASKEDVYSLYNSWLIFHCIALIALIQLIRTRWSQSFMSGPDGWDGNLRTATGTKWLASIGLTIGVWAISELLFSYVCPNFLNIHNAKLEDIKNSK